MLQLHKNISNRRRSVIHWSQPVSKNFWENYSLGVSNYALLSLDYRIRVCKRIKQFVLIIPMYPQAYQQKKYAPRGYNRLGVRRSSGCPENLKVFNTLDYVSTLRVLVVGYSEITTTIIPQFLEITTLIPVLVTLPVVTCLEITTITRRVVFLLVIMARYF